VKEHLEASRGFMSAPALWNFASGEPAKGRIPQGESAANYLLATGIIAIIGYI
jgi:hypothetical protein